MFYFKEIDIEMLTFRKKKYFLNEHKSIILAYWLNKYV